MAQLPSSPTPSASPIYKSVSGSPCIRRIEFAMRGVKEAALHPSERGPGGRFIRAKAAGWGRGGSGECHSLRRCLRRQSARRVPSRGRVGRTTPGLELPAMATSLRSLARVLRLQAQRAPLAAASSRPSPGPCAQAGAGVAWCNGAGSLRWMSGDHTAKWMQNTDNKSPMELIAEVPPIKVDARVAACEGGTDPALGHPIEYISLDGAGPHVCKYCGLRYFQGNAHGHH